MIVIICDSYNHKLMPKITSITLLATLPLCLYFILLRILLHLYYSLYLYYCLYICQLIHTETAYTNTTYLY